MTNTWPPLHSRRMFSPVRDFLCDTKIIVIPNRSQVRFFEESFWEKSLPEFHASELNISIYDPFQQNERLFWANGQCNINYPIAVKSPVSLSYFYGANPKKISITDAKGGAFIIKEAVSFGYLVSLETPIISEDFTPSAMMVKCFFSGISWVPIKDSKRKE